MRLAVIIAHVVLATGCGSFIDKQAATSTYRILQKSTEAAQRQVDVQLARDAMPAGLIQLEAFALAYPEHAGFKTMHADAYCQYAVAFVFDDWEDAKLGGRLDEADRIAERLGPLLAQCAELNLARLPPAWRTARNSDDPAPTRKLLAAATRDQVPALLWLATTDAVRIAIDPMRQLALLARTEATLRRCSELAPGYQRGGAELLLGTLEAGRGAIDGTTDGHAWFQRARSFAGAGALMIDVMYARGTAVARKDRGLFRSTLERVLATDVTRWPDRRLDNELARRKARRYLAASDALVP